MLPCWGRVCSVRGHGSHIKPSLVTALCSALHCGSMAVRGVECEGEDGYVAARDTRARRNAARGEDALAEAVLTIMRCMWWWAMVERVRHVPAGEPAPAL